MYKLFYIYKYLWILKIFYILNNIIFLNISAKVFFIFLDFKNINLNEINIFKSNFNFINLNENINL